MDIKENNSLSPHRVCLLVLFIFSSIIMRFEHGMNFLSLAAALALCLLLLPAVWWLLSFIAAPERLDSKPKHSAILAVFHALLTLYALWAAGVCALEFTGFVGKIVLPDTADLIILIPFLALCVWISTKKPAVILKISAVAFPFIVISALVLFALSFPRFNFDALSSFDDTVWGESLEFFGKNSLPALSLFTSLPAALIFLSISRESSDKKSFLPKLFLGIMSGVFLFALCTAQIFLIFNSDYLATLDSPYISATTVIAAGDFFLRADGLVYVMMFMCSMIKTAVCFLAAAALCGRYGKKFGRCILILGGAAIAAAAFFI